MVDANQLGALSAKEAQRRPRDGPLPRKVLNPEVPDPNTGPTPRQDPDDHDTDAKNPVDHEPQVMINGILGSGTPGGVTRRGWTWRSASGTRCWSGSA